MFLLLILSVIGIYGFEHKDHNSEPMGEDDWSSETMGRSFGKEWR